MKLSIIITTRNRKKQLFACIQSVKNLDFTGIVWELIVIDDNSSDGTEKLNFDSFGIKSGKLIHTDKNVMMVRARNLGVENSVGQFLVFIDDDNIVDAEMIENLIKVAESSQHIGIVGPAMYYQDTGKKYFNYQKINFFTGKTTSYLSDEDKLFSSDGIPNVFLIKREVFNKSGKFDEKLIQTLTEPDFAFNARKFNYECVGTNRAKTFHNISASQRFRPEDLGGDYVQKAYCLIRNRSYIIGKYGKFYHKIIYMVFFSWVWPLAYSLVVVGYGRFDLVKLYWLGWKDGVAYLFSGKLIKSIS